MAFRLPGLFNGSFRTPFITAGAVAAFTCLATPMLHYRRPILLDSSPSAVSPKDWSFNQYQSDAQVPIVKNGSFNARSVRQLSMGSILGLFAGLGVSLFSKPLALLLGLLIAGSQAAESYGIHLIPWKTAQKYVTGIDLRSAVQDNVAFKISFGLMFALSAFAELPQ